MVLAVLERDEHEEERPCELEMERERASRKVAEDRGEEGDIIEEDSEKAD